MADQTNEEIFLQYATTDEAFRNALKSGDVDELSKELDRIGIQIADQDRAAVLDAITKIDWSDLKHLEDILLGQVHPLN
jgi:ATP/maltotriose-dependent transcriptional regulator MalT